MRKTILILTTLGVLAGVSSRAQTTTTAPDDWVKRVKNPTSWFTWGADLRLRNEYYENAASLNPLAGFHDQDYFRFRGRFYATIKPVEKLSLNTRITAEPRYWAIESSSGYFRNRRGMDWQEGIIDILNVRWDEAFGQPLTLTVGRQDMRFGDGWLVMDATPLDGSRTFFFDAARVTWALKEHNTTVDFAYIEQSAMNDAWLPPINRKWAKPLTDQDERGAILWVNNSSIKELNLDAYFMYKHDHDLATGNGVNSDLYTPGLRLSGLLGDHWKYRTEGAVQFGKRQEPRISTAYNDVLAFGFNSRLSYLLKDKWNNQFHFDYEYLSGDDPSTAKNEMFDVLWGRWPRFSEMYIYSYAPENRVAQLSNLHRFGPGWTVNPTKQMEIIANYNLLYADESAPALTASPNFTRTGSFRGHYLQAVLKYQFCKQASGHLWAEFLFPGDYYTFQERHTFLRAEVLLTF